MNASRAFAGALFLCVAAGPACPEAVDDAAYIVEQTITTEMLGASLQALGPLIASALENDLRANGVEVSDYDLFAGIVFDELTKSFVEDFRGEVINVYLDAFSPRELSDIATFYRSQSGQSLLRKSPGLMIEGARIGQEVGVKLGESIDHDRVLSRLEREGVLVHPAAR